LVYTTVFFFNGRTLWRKKAIVELDVKEAKIAGINLELTATSITGLTGDKFKEIATSAK
jgi:hypothetical protein